MKFEKYRDKVYQMILILLTCAVLLPTLTCLTVFALDAKYDVEVSNERFMTDDIHSENAHIEVDEEGKAVAEFLGESPSISMNVNPIEAKSAVNALRVVIKNDSACEMLTVEYKYKNSAQISQTANLSEAMVPYSGATEYLLYTPNIGTATWISLSFGGVDSGSVELWSLGALSYYHDNREYFGELTENVYSKVDKKAKFSGTVSYETVVGNPNASIVLYRLDQTEIIEDVRFVHPYVASCPMSLTYSFDFEIESASDYCSRYFAAVLTPNNKIIPLTPETYLREKNAYRDDQAENGIEVGFKGIETNLYSGAIENGTAVAFVDVYLDKLGSSDGIGYQYVLDDGKEYYFDRKYVLELDAEIGSFASSGVPVYLRFLLDSASPMFGHAEREVHPEGVKYFAVNPRNDDTVDNIFAYTDFICSRYADGNALKGIIIGRSLDKADAYNYCGSISMNDYADMLARTYSIIHSALDRSLSGVEILIPMSDDKIGVDVVLDPESVMSDYPTDLLASSLLIALKRYGSEISSLGFVLESNDSPMLSEGKWSSGDFITATNCGDFIKMVEKLNDQYGTLSKEIMFCWFPSPEMSSYDVISAYICNYNVLSCTEGVRSYILSIFEERAAEIPEGEEALPITSERDFFLVLSNTYKYADTHNNSELGETVLDALGVNDWSEIIDGYDWEETVKRTLIENSLIYEPEKTALGSYKMWDFTSSNGLKGWSKSVGCTRLVVNTPHDGDGRMLSVTITPEEVNKYGAKYGSIVYYAPKSLLMRDISAFSFDTLINGGAEGELFEIRITAHGDGIVLESTGTVRAGERTTVYADISVLDRVRYIKIGIRSLESENESEVEMRIGSISIHSEKYDSGELEDMVLSGEMVGRNEQEEEKSYRSIMTVSIVILASILTVSLIWVCFLVIYKRLTR